MITCVLCHTPKDESEFGKQSKSKCSACLRHMKQVIAQRLKDERNARLAAMSDKERAEFHANEKAKGSAGGKKWAESLTPEAKEEWRLKLKAARLLTIQKKKEAFNALSEDEKCKILDMKLARAKEKRIKSRRAWYDANRDSLIAKSKERSKKPSSRATQKKWRDANKRSQAIKQKEYKIKNREKVNAYVAKWRKERYANDPMFRMQVILRDKIRQAVKTQHTEQALGCTFAEFKSYIESKFTEGMTWENFGKHGWHIDHIRPLSWFDVTDPNQVLTANHFSNLQPLWAHINLSKNNRYEG